jgi:hypothetical protein
LGGCESYRTDAKIERKPIIHEPYPLTHNG